MEFDILFLDTFLGLPCWLLWLLASLLSGLLGYLIGRAQYKPCCDKVAEAEAEVKKLHAGITDWEAKYRELQYKRDELDKDNTALRASLNQCEADKAALNAKILSAADTGDASARTLGFADGGTGGGGTDYVALVGQDNLQIIEGIGPKIEGLLHDAGIMTWEDLANAPTEKVQQILDDAGPRYRMHQPTTWAKQARMAADAQWEELVAYQDRLDGGREPEEK